MCPFKFRKYLVEEIKVDVCVQDDQALREACSSGYINIVKYLIQNGSNLQNEKNNPLTYACRDGCLEIVKYLVDKGVNIHFNNDIALKYAFHNDHSKIVKYLVSKGADIKKCENIHFQN